MSGRRGAFPRFRVSLPQDAPAPVPVLSIPLPAPAAVPSMSEEPAWLEPLSLGPAFVPIPAGIDPEDQEDLFDELARRLEQAAAEMGIDVEA